VFKFSVRSRRAFFLLTCAAFALTSGSALLGAGTATATLTVTATVAAECTVGGSTLAFGGYSTLSGSPTDQSTTFSVACTTGTAATMGMDLGANASGGARRMSNGSGGFLEYELYSDGARTAIWANSGGGLVAYNALSNGAQSQTVYGRIPAGQDANLGSYSDSVTITITF
jgi:spore coat protein U-like protein